MNVLGQNGLGDLPSASRAAAAAALRVPLSGCLVRLEPLERRHAPELAAAAAESDWRLMPIDASRRPGFDWWLDWMLGDDGQSDPCDPRAAFAVVDRGVDRATGSTSFHAVHPQHRRVEIGMTWY